jgi:hypothetical protein
MRLVKLLLVATLALPTAASAQGRVHRPAPAHSVPGTPPARAVVPFPQGGITLPQIGLPLPRLGLAPFPNETSRVDWFHDNGGAGRIDWFHDRASSATAFVRARNYGARVGTSVVRTPFVGAPIIFYVPQFVTPIEPPAPAPPAREEIETQLTTGSFVLQVAPATAQVFVDGYYFGTPGDFDGQRGELALEPGTHRVELVAPGYETETDAVNIAPHQTVSYQNAMKPVAAASPPPPAAPVTPKTLYLVPGCYLGDVPPKDVRLPVTCDVSRVVTFER